MPEGRWILPRERRRATRPGRRSRLLDARLLRRRREAARRRDRRARSRREAAQRLDPSAPWRCGPAFAPEGRPARCGRRGAAAANGGNPGTSPSRPRSAALAEECSSRDGRRRVPPSTASRRDCRRLIARGLGLRRRRVHARRGVRVVPTPSLRVRRLLAGRADIVSPAGSRPDCLYTQMGFSRSARSPHRRCSPFDAAADGPSSARAPGSPSSSARGCAAMETASTRDGVGLSNESAEAPRPTGSSARCAKPTVAPRGIPGI